MKQIANEVKDEVATFRSNGLSLREIARDLHISLGSAFTYSQGIQFSNKQRLLLKRKNYENTLGKLPLQKRLEACKKGGIHAPKKFKTIYSKIQLISFIKKFYSTFGRIPFKREFQHTKAIRNRFGTWNNAIKEAGFDPNPVKFSKKYIANDGHRCDSLAEKIIDDWLYLRKVPHEIKVPYGKNRMTADFKVNGVLIEFFGLIGEVKSYDRLVKEKEKLWKEWHLKVIKIYPNDLFPISKLDSLLCRL